MTGFSNPLVGGGGALVYPAIKSPNFSLAGQTGWAIMKDGTAYFFSVTAQGTITATAFHGANFIINSQGEFFYSGPPAAGNLVLSRTQSNGVDQFGNAVLAGDAVYNNVLSGGVFRATALSSGQLAFFTAPTLGGGAFNWTQKSSVNWDPANNAIDLSGAVLIAGNLDGTTATFTGAVSLDGGAVVSGSNLDISGTSYITLQDNPSVPGATATEAQVYANSGHQNVNAGDGNSYDTERLTGIATGQTVTGVTFNDVAGTRQNVGVGQYRVQGQMDFLPSQAAGIAEFQFTGTCVLSGMRLNLTEVVSAAANVAFTPGVSGDLTALSVVLQGTVFANTNRRVWKIDGTITVTTAGTFGIQTACSVGGDSFVIPANGAYLELLPVVA